jgi:predicted transcriptional regulator of viral defense system
MKYIDLYKKLQDSRLYLFSTQDLFCLFPKEKKEILRQQIHYWKKHSWVRALKNGLYEIIYPEEKNIPDLFLANKLYSPSYVSLETALSIYNIIPEVAFGITSITTKPTREFKNYHGFFKYRSVRPRGFIGYRIIEENKFKIKIAEPEKALVDYIYFKLYDGDKVNVEEERFDLSVLKKLKKQRLYNYASNFNKMTYKTLREIYAKL